MSDCKIYKVEKVGKDLFVDINMPSLKKPKALEVSVETLPCDMEATIELHEFDKHKEIKFGIPRGCAGDDGESIYVDSIVEDATNRQTKITFSTGE